MMTMAPSAAEEFQTLSGFGWYTIGPILTATLFHWLYMGDIDYFPAPIVYAVSFIIYSAGSLVCFLSKDSIMLIFGQCTTGVGTSGIIFSSSFLIAKVERPKQWNLQFLIYNVASAVALFFGPFYGALFTTKVTWRAYFGVNGIASIPLALAVSLLSPKITFRPSRAFLLNRSALFHVFVVVVKLGLLVIIMSFLQLGGLVFPWTAPQVVAPLVLCSSILLYAELRILWIQRASLRDEIQSFAVLLHVAGNRAAYYVAIAYLSLRFQTLCVWNSLESAIGLTPLILTGAVFALLPWIIQAKGLYMVSLFIALLLAPIGAGLNSTISIDTSSSLRMVYGTLLGIGTGLSLNTWYYVACINLPSAGILDPARLFRFSECLTSLMLALAQGLFQSFLVDELSQGLPGFQTSQLLTSGPSTFLHSLNDTAHGGDGEICL